MKPKTLLAGFLLPAAGKMTPLLLTILLMPEAASLSPKASAIRR